MRYLMGLDLGTTTVKASIYDEKGNPLQTASVERILLTPKAGYYEQDAGEWYRDSASVIKEVVIKARIEPEEIVGLSISSQGITTVPVDENIEPLAPAINWMDVRPVEIWKDFLEGIGIEYVRQQTGFPVTVEKPKAVAKILWVKRHQPKVFERARWFLMPASFLTAKLTGNVVTDPSMAVGSLLFSNYTMSYDLKLLKAAGLEEEILAPVVPAGSPAGYLTEKAAVECGLTTSCMVVVGGQDQKVAAYGVGASVNEPSCSLGTSAAFEYISNTLSGVLGPDFKHCPHVEQGQYALETCINTAGGAIRWLRDTVCSDGTDFEKMNQLADEAEPGCRGTLFLPFLGGHPKGSSYGGFMDVGIHTTREELIRAVYEGIAYESRYLMEKVHKKAECLHVHSGGSKSPVLAQIISDVLGVKILTFFHSEMGSLGAAKLAAKGIGMDVTDFGKGCLSKSISYEPKLQDKFYAEYYNKYCQYRDGI